MTSTPVIVSEMTSDDRRATFMDAGLALGFDPDTLRALWAPSASAVPVPPSRLGPLTDAEWRAIKPHLPENVLAASGASPRQMLDVMLWRVRYRHAGWRNLPIDVAPAPDMARQKWARWVSGGVLADLMEAMPALNLGTERRQEFGAVGRMITKAAARAGE